MFNTLATVSFVDSSFVRKAILSSRSPVKTVISSLSSGENYPCHYEFKGMLVSIMVSELSVDVKEFVMLEFDGILGINWLSKYHARIQYRDQKVLLRDSKGNRISYSGAVVKKGVKWCSL